MKILQLSNKNPYPPKDGGELAIKMMADGLAHYADDFMLLMMTTSKHPKDENTYRQQPYQVKNIPVDVPIKAGALLKNLLFSSVPYPIERFEQPSYTLALKQILQTKLFDIIQLESLYLAPYIKLIRHYAPQAKIILRAHNVESAIWQRNAKIESSFLKKIYLKMLASRMQHYEQTYIQSVDAVVAISPIDMEVMKQWKPTLNGIVIPFGINMEKYPDTPCHWFDNKNSVQLAYLGALDWYPNQEGLKWFLAQVWQKFHAKHNSIYFHIAGRRAPTDLEIFFRNQKGVIYHGEIDNAETYLKTYPVFITPLFSGSGMRIKLIEQMASKRLVVATPLAAEGISVEHEKNILLAENANQMLTILEYLTNNLNQFKPLVKQAYNLVARTYNNQVLINNLMQYYLSLLKHDIS